MSKPVTVSDATFDQEVLKSDVPVLVDFWAVWCGPCRMVAPILDEIAEEKAGSLKVAKVNVDENARVAAQLGITSIPTLILYKDGQPVERIIGAHPKQRLLQQIEKHLS
ncbi:thioredoxin [Sphaerobacter thermophilus]|jgi:thioredoxin 1|uniref:Thioredoxin n=1 Tax=Sphaerobacter thermophilus (strain ATCC 49802 / DSM 20745 / KCCM 41009 / NCIMB 13125 / S 6022) TaxID=479434 RepID=D1C649_SPHTD|nr:thioredoxin [Sphaerobacter thermophilus]ACZ37587.1 thioredoxin [Sphaerobacter thermophilus DSM 20745]PZN62683.1 MAG: thioredoxin [Sphaerobacter thermophilus]